MSIVTTDDFKSGRYTLSLNPNQKTDLQISIDYVENLYLKRLFGVTLEALFQADLTAGGGYPTEARFQYVYDAFDYQDSSGPIYSSEGIKEMLKGIIYFHYIRDLNAKAGANGVVKTKSANSENVGADSLSASSRYNEGINSYWSIQAYMDYLNDADYPEYEGQPERKTNPF